MQDIDDLLRVVLEDLAVANIERIEIRRLGLVLVEGNLRNEVEHNGCAGPAGIAHFVEIRRRDLMGFHVVDEEAVLDVAGPVVEVEPVVDEVDEAFFHLQSLAIGRVRDVAHVKADRLVARLLFALWHLEAAVPAANVDVELALSWVVSAGADARAQGSLESAPFVENDPRLAEGLEGIGELLDPAVPFFD